MGGVSSELKEPPLEDQLDRIKQSAWDHCHRVVQQELAQHRVYPRPGPIWCMVPVMRPGPQGWPCLPTAWHNEVTRYVEEGMRQQGHAVLMLADGVLLVSKPPVPGQ